MPPKRKYEPCSSMPKKQCQREKNTGNGVQVATKIYSNGQLSGTCGRDKPKRTKAMDIHFHWLQYIKLQRQFRLYWRLGTKTYANYWEKHHPEAHHKVMQPEILTSKSILNSPSK